MQGLNWSFPYFSGAANHRHLFEWRISPSDFESVSRMGAQEYLGYRHQATADSVPNIVNNYGYVLAVYAARHIFPWMGDGNAVVALQLMAHVVIVLVTLGLLGTDTERAVFFLFYGINPVVLHFVTFPYYYFWTALPCCFIALAWYCGPKLRLWY